MLTSGIVRREAAHAACVALYCMGQVHVAAAQTALPIDDAGTAVTVEKLNVSLELVAIRPLLILSERIEGQLPSGDEAFSEWLSEWTTQLSEEVNEEPFRRLVSESLGKDGDPTKGLRFRVTENTRALEVSGTPVSDDATTTGVGRVKRYVEQRLEGHSKEYAEASLLAAGSPPSEGLSSFAKKVLDRYPDVPPDWLRPVPEWDAGGSSGFPDRKRLIVIDGPVAWVYSETSFPAGVELIRVDALEFDAKKGPIIRDVRRQVDDLLRERPNLALGLRAWTILERRLEEQHGIKWLSPGLLNPEIMFD